MPRKLKTVKYTEGVPVLAVCERCNEQFKTPMHALGDLNGATDILQKKFDVHICKPLDSSQNALRIVREATEGK
jgi:hypothetical protein